MGDPIQFRSQPDSTITVGCDPELFMFRNGHFLSGHELKLGPKTAPKKTEHGFVQNDGVALEFNIHPAKNRLEFVTNIKNTLGDLRQLVKDYDSTSDIVARPTVFVGKEKLSKLPPFVQELGCTPDFDAYTGQRNPAPNANAEFRTGAGHIHVGWTFVQFPNNFTHVNKCRELIKQLDYFVGLPSMLWDKDNTRRALYGKAGAFRPKKYGVEYRTLSNAWLKDPKIAGFIYDQTMKAVNALEKGEVLDNECYGLAKELINGNSIYRWKKDYPELYKRIMGP